MVPVASPFIRPHTVPPGKTKQHQPPPAQRPPPPGSSPPLSPSLPHHFYTHPPPYPPPLPLPHPMYGHPIPYHVYPPYGYLHPPLPLYPYHLPPLLQPPTLTSPSPSTPSLNIIPYTLESDSEKTPLSKSAREPLSPPLTPLPAEAHHRYNHELPTPLRALIIHSLQSGTSQREIALIYNLPHSTVSRTIKRYNETGCLRSSQRNGAPRRLEERDIDELVEVIRGDPRIGIKELLGRTRVRVCRGTLVARLKERNGLRRDHRKGIWMEKYGNIVRKKKEGRGRTEAEVEAEAEREPEESEGNSGDERDESLEESTEPVIVNESDSRSGSETPTRTSPAPPVENPLTVRHTSQPPYEPTSSHISVPIPPCRLRSEPPSLQDLMNPPESKESSGGNGTVQSPAMS